MIAAFHFHQRSPDGWDCGKCRSQGLDRGRKCGWQGFGTNSEGIVWAGGNAATTRCPKSEIRGESIAWLEMFAAIEWLGMDVLAHLESRDGEAMTVLAQEAERNRADGTRR